MYQADAPVLWCPSCLTVLAREQTEDEHCERCGARVVERVMRQWFLRMTAFADRLLAGLNDLDWPERAKRLQRGWIGRSEGREVDFGDLTVFTTRPDTLPAVTFLAVPLGHAAAGSTRPHPLTGEEIPVYEADYVAADYGTGAVMGVPGHDERDARFAEANNIPTSNAPLLAGDGAADIGRPATRYRMRDWLISRQRYWGPPIPIVNCPECGPVAVPEDQLPVVLPDLDDFRPTGAGLSPLATAEDWLRVQCPDCGGDAHRETDVSDTFVDSSWYFLRYPSTEFDDRPWDPERTARVLPVDFYAGGPEHVQRHHLYARFVTLALHDLGHVPFEEPFPVVRLGGFIVHRGAKMSKSRGNVVIPDEYVARHGGDVLRCALLFSAPWQDGGDFQLDAIAGVERFFARLWRLSDADDAPDADGYVIDRTIRDVEDAIERLRFNVAIAKLMQALPNVRSHSSRRALVRLLAPLAPYLAEELWQRVGEPFSVHAQPWPEWSDQNVAAEVVTVVVQVDGKVRARLEVAVGASEEEALGSALADERVMSALRGDEIRRVVFVPDRVINLVT
jgi:leucyl-tRNA synthetase